MTIIDKVYEIINTEHNITLDELRDHFARLTDVPTELPEGQELDVICYAVAKEITRLKKERSHGMYGIGIPELLAKKQNERFNDLLKKSLGK